VSQFLISLNQLLSQGLSFLFSEEKLDALANYVAPMSASLTGYHIESIHQLVRKTNYHATIYVQSGHLFLVSTTL